MFFKHKLDFLTFTVYTNNAHIAEHVPLCIFGFLHKVHSLAISDYDG